MKIKMQLKMTAIAMALICSGAHAAETDREKVELMHETTLRALAERDPARRRAAVGLLFLALGNSYTIGEGVGVNDLFNVYHDHRYQAPPTTTSRA